MINYMKSEMYRNVRTKGNYKFLFGLMGFVIFINVALGIYANSQVDFPYGNTNFSLSSLYSSLTVPMCLCLILCSTVFGQEYKCHTLKNSVSYGISRTHIYFGKLIMEIVISFINFICITGAYIISAYVMLEDSGPIYLENLFHALIGGIPLFIFSLVVAHSFLSIYDNERTTAMAVQWAIIVIIIPNILALAGKKISICRTIASWMPWNLASSSYDRIANRMIMPVSTDEGFIKCYIAGIIGSIIFLILGLVFFNKKEIK
ncbi:hypothetical protein SH1V18_01910 [Vallitalea longa]|uniref:Uncharacterized protein n=1 Tax=Vallitalea longa TaxID=2936439 RepID=A0A9W5Y840_9FIRM|nr:ABC transporter permease subunit [Vallitalea longa]GKX27711.1 hypothetical protein SH1V18_01910 [Vallitalea longa]